MISQWYPKRFAQNALFGIKKSHDKRTFLAYFRVLLQPARPIEVVTFKIIIFNSPNKLQPARPIGDETSLNLRVIYTARLQPALPIGDFSINNA